MSPPKAGEVGGSEKTPATPSPLHGHCCQRVASLRCESLRHLYWPELGGDNRCPWGRCLTPGPAPHPPRETRPWRSAPPSECPETEPLPGVSGALPAGQRPEAAWTRQDPGFGWSFLRALPSNLLDTRLLLGEEELKMGEIETETERENV